MSMHTAGPWNCDGRDIRKADTPSPLLARVFSLVETAPQYGVRPTEADANARLIAAAPTQHAELKQVALDLALWIERETQGSQLTHFTHQEMRERLIAVRAAIDKARE
jgi:hypothetical protein